MSPIQIPLPRPELVLTASNKGANLTTGLAALLASRHDLPRSGVPRNTIVAQKKGANTRESLKRTAKHPAPWPFLVSNVSEVRQ